MGDSSSRHQSSGTNHYRGKSDSLFAAETQQIEHEQEQEHSDAGRRASKINL
jgi:hypothetical protein